MWENEVLVAPSDKTQNPSSLVTGYGTPVLADGRVYHFHTYPTGLDPAEILAKAEADHKFRMDYPEQADESVLCVEAATGKTLWHRTWEKNGVTVTGSNKQGGHYTMAIADGRAYAFGSTGRIYCLDAVTGETIWETHNHPKVHAPNCAPAVAEGVLIYREGRTLFGYRADTGERIWSHGGVEKGTRSSAFTRIWQAGKRKLFVHENICLDPITGKVLWSIGDTRSGNRTAILGDIMVTGGTRESPGPRGWRISPRGVEQLWQYRPEGAEWVAKGFSSPTFIDGWAVVDMQAPRKNKDGTKDTLFALFHLETGKAVTMDGHYKAWKYQPIVAEGKYFYFSNPLWGFWIGRLDPANFGPIDLQKMNPDDWASDTSAAYVCGVLYIRSHNHLACYDLRARR